MNNENTNLKAENYGLGVVWPGESVEGECNEGVCNEGVCRRRREPTERILRIHELIAGGTFPTCGKLAARFEVSEKTISRDLEYMRDYFEMPIEYDAARHG